MTEPNTFPVQAFPEAIQQILLHWSECYQTPPEYVGTAMLSAASVLCGNRFHIEYKPGFTEAPVVFAALVGTAGMRKSATLKQCLEPLMNLDKAMFQSFTEELSAWQAAKQHHRVPRPKRRQIIISDHTFSACLELLAANPLGVLLYRDELIFWLRNESVRHAEFWLTVFEGIFLKVSGARKHPVVITHPFISIIGTLPPGEFRQWASHEKAAGGLLSRFLFALPDDLKIPLPEPLPADLTLQSRYRQYAQLFHQLPADPEGNPLLLQMSARARQLYADFVNQRIIEEKDQQEWLGKPGRYALRLALLLELMQLAASGGTPDLHTMKNQQVGEQAMHGAILLCRYFDATTRKLLSREGNPLMALPGRQQEVYRVLPPRFRTSYALEQAKKLKVAESTLKRLLRNQQLFRQERTGIYTKIQL